jgi:lipid A 3-O-deacylase
MLQRLLIVFFGFASLATQAQEQTEPPLAHELAFTSENDAYLFRRHDAYYTNGVFMRFTSAGLRKSRKIIRSYEAGQLIYTPLIRKTQTAADIDRPYCGYLFGKYSRSAFTNEAILQYSGTLGVVGAASLGEGLQETYHSLLGYGQFTGWRYQVQNAVGIDAGLLYAQTFWEDSSWAKLVPVMQLSLGTNYTNARVGAFFCLGALEKNSNSVLWNARVQKTAEPLRRHAEFFVYWYPELEWQGYNATVQGGFFNKGNGAVLTELQRMMFNNSFGICYAAGNCTLKFAIIFQDRETVSQKTIQQYGSMQLSYRLR